MDSEEGKAGARESEARERPSEESAEWRSPGGGRSLEFSRGSVSARVQESDEAQERPLSAEWKWRSPGPVEFSRGYVSARARESDEARERPLLSSEWRWRSPGPMEFSRGYVFALREAVTRSSHVSIAEEADEEESSVVREVNGSEGPLGMAAASSGDPDAPGETAEGERKAEERKEEAVETEKEGKEEKRVLGGRVLLSLRRGLEYYGLLPPSDKASSRRLASPVPHDGCCCCCSGTPGTPFRFSSIVRGPFPHCFLPPAERQPLLPVLLRPHPLQVELCDFEEQFPVKEAPRHSPVYVERVSIEDCFGAAGQPAGPQVRP